MFDKFSNKSMATSSEKFDTLIGRTTTIQGTLTLLDSIRIDGRVVGNVESAPDCKIAVAIGPTGEVTGDIKAHRVMVAGKVFGHIHAADRVEFQKDSLVQGDISYGSIAVEHGARLLGLVIQNPSSAAAANSSTDAKNVIRKAQESSG